jgi:hypothetical protein
LKILSLSLIIINGFGRVKHGSNFGDISLERIEVKYFGRTYIIGNIKNAPCFTHFAQFRKFGRLSGPSGDGPRYNENPVKEFKKHRVYGVSIIGNIYAGRINKG